MVGKILAAQNDSGPENFIIGASLNTLAHLPGRATPSVRSLAQHPGVDLQSITGTGRNGLVNTEDVEQAASLNRCPGLASRCAVSANKWR